MTDFFIDIGITVLLRLLATKKIPKGYVKGLTKLRDALNIALPVDEEVGTVGQGFKIVN